MKRKGNLYQNIYNFDNIVNAYNEVCKNTNNFIFLGRDASGRYSKYRDVKRKIKKRKYLYNIKQITLSSFVSSIICYQHLLKKGNNL